MDARYREPKTPREFDSVVKPPNPFKFATGQSGVNGYQARITANFPPVVDLIDRKIMAIARGAGYSHEIEMAPYYTTRLSLDPRNPINY